MPDYIKYLQLPSPFVFHRGGRLYEAELQYETWGQLNPSADNAVLILTGLSPDSHACRHHKNDQPGWWEFMIGPGKAIDTDQFYVICASSLGSCKGSTGPASINPKNSRAYRFDFPDLCLQDVANSNVLLCRHLGIDRLHAIVGPSMGGMTGTALLQQHPGFARHWVQIAAGLASPPFSTAIRSLQREAIINDNNFNRGFYSREDWPIDGMKFARKIGMLSYRSAKEWNERFPRSLKKVPDHPFGIEFPVESYLEHHANRFIHQFDPICYLYLSRAMDWFDAYQYKPKTAPHNPLADINIESALILGTETDLLFPIDLQKQVSDLLDKASIDNRLYITDSIQGHDAFLVDEDTFSKLVADYLSATV
ncbi:homoserine O-acetyltransferase MetX [Marinicella gelatinilytica]|uniref:homoserine O-acetyltransferase MetX n=1 Tax=Marinicella gelatinilytica TaxID=2996017 RepID=UPI002260C8DE|nr:homoserine O-acetyltransferase [Marinicella gelatinilytica]MCX7544454.1 homoserine O-acetyltransferase [Marinicella gelatinilytica]